MVLVNLGRGRDAKVDEADLPKLVRQRWFAVTRADGYIYSFARIGGQKVAMHRFLLDAEPGTFVDHINGDGLDNRRENLRVCTHAENMRNRRRSRASSNPYKGVNRTARNTWRVRVGGPGNRVTLNGFASAKEAAAIYDIVAVLRYGEFACLNFPHVFPEIAQRKA